MIEHEEEKVLPCVWETEIIDKDGDLWIDTVMNMMIIPIYEQMNAMPTLMVFPLEVILEGN